MLPFRAEAAPRFLGSADAFAKAPDTVLPPASNHLWLNRPGQNHGQHKRRVIMCSFEGDSHLGSRPEETSPLGGTFRERIILAFHED